MGLLIGTGIVIFCCKSALLRGSKYSKKGDFGHIAFFLRSELPHLHTEVTSRIYNEGDGDGSFQIFEFFHFNYSALLA